MFPVVDSKQKSDPTVLIDRICFNRTASETTSSLVLEQIIPESLYAFPHNASAETKPLMLL